MGSVTSALTRTRNALVKVGSEPVNHTDPERSHSAPGSASGSGSGSGSDWAKKRTARFNVPAQSSRQSLSEVLSQQGANRPSVRRRAAEDPQAVANEDGDCSSRPQASFSRSKSQSALWNAITAGMGIKGKEQKPLLNDPRSPEEILAEDLPGADQPDATERIAISL